MVKKKTAETVHIECSGKHHTIQAKFHKLSDKKAAKQASAQAAEAKSASAGKKRAKDEIDAIFQSQKKQTTITQDEKHDGQQPSSQEPQETAKQIAAEQAKSKTSRVQGSKDDIFGEQVGKARKRTEEGYAIYGEDELGLGKKGGDTPLCPFDCDCCY